MALARGIQVTCRQQGGELDAAALRDGDELLEAVQDADHGPHLVGGDLVGDLALRIAHRERAVLERQLDQCVAHLAVVEDVLALLAAQHLVERRLRDEDASALHELGHLPEEEGEQERADVASVHVCVGHDDDAAVAQLGVVEVLADAALERLDQRADFLEAEHLVQARALHVEELSAQRQDGLVHVVAAALGAAACAVTLDDEELGLLDVGGGAVRQLVRHAARIERALALDEFARLACRLAGLCRKLGAVADALGVRRVFLEPCAQQLVERAADEGSHLGVEELLLGLVVERGVLQLDADDGAQALAQVLAGDLVLAVLEEAGAARVAVDGHGERLLERGDVRAAVAVGDVVAEGQQELAHRVRVLHGDVGAHAADLVLAGDGDHRALHVLGGVDVPHVAGQAVGGVEGLLADVAGGVDALVAQVDLHARVQEAELAQAMLEALELEVGVGEDLVVGLEADARAVAARGLALGDHVERGADLAAREGDLVGLGTLVDLHLGPLAERIDALDADAVQAARHLVRIAVELAAGVHLGEDHLHRGSAVDGRVLVPHRVHRHAAAVVLHHAAAVHADGHEDLGGVAGHHLVDGVVDALVDEVVQAFGSGAADVHARALADRLESLEHLDGARRVLVGGRRGVRVRGRRCGDGCGIWHEVRVKSYPKPRLSNACMRFGRMRFSPVISGVFWGCAAPRPGVRRMLSQSCGLVRSGSARGHYDSVMLMRNRARRSLFRRSFADVKANS